MPEQDDKPVIDPKKVEDFLATAKARYDRAAEEEKELRQEFETDVQYEAGDSWDPLVKAKRIAAGRPALDFPRMHTFVQQVSNEARQNKPQIKFAPREGGDEETAEIYEGMARHIQYDSDAQVAYETAVEYAATGGFGYYRFLTDYCNDENDDQDLKILPIYDPLAVYGILIPACFGQEAKYAFVTEHFSKEEYEALYPGSELASLDWTEAQKQGGNWCTDRIRVAEYWWVEEERAKNKAGRVVTRSRVKTCKINGVEVLADTETEWPGSCIPIIPVLGKQRIVKGKPKLISVIRHQRAPQQLLNLHKSRIAETLGVAPVSPYIAYEGTLAGHEREWMNANGAYGPIPAVLQAKPVMLDDRTAAPLPQRQTFEPPIQALSEAAAQEIDDMKAAAGIFDASLGAQSNETSGIALQRRQQQSSGTNMHFLDNLGRAFNKGGEVIAEVMPKIYDTPRMVRILGEDEAPKIVKINELWAADANSQPKHYKVGGDGVGKYDVVVTMGRAFSSKKMESFDMYVQMGQSNPEMALVTSDLMLRNSDMAGADEAADRMKKYIAAKFPGVIEEDEQGDPEQQLMQLQAQAQQLQQQLQVAMQVGQEMHQELAKYQAGVQVKQMDIDFQREKLALEDKKLQFEMAKHNATLDSQEAQTLLKAEVDVAMHGQQLDAQAAAAEANAGAQEIGG